MNNKHITIFQTNKLLTRLVLMIIICLGIRILKDAINNCCKHL